LLVIISAAAGSYFFVSNGGGQAQAPVHGVQAEPVGPIEFFQLPAAITQRRFDLSAAASAPATAPAVPIDVTRSYPFVWPASGPLTSYNGPNHPTGIDIGLGHDSVANIYATAPGVVSFAGGAESGDYGFYVMIDHGNGLSSLYAHLSQINVRRGQKVEQGHVVGQGGSTGKSTGKHLHFEITSNDQVIDPLRLLPSEPKLNDKVALDCTSGALVLNQGSRARFDLTRLLGGSPIANVRLEVLTVRGEATGAVLTADSPSSLLFSTQPRLGGSSTDNEFRVHVDYASSDGIPTALACDVVVRPVNVAPSFYVRTLPPIEGSNGTETPTATITGTHSPGEGGSDAEVVSALIEAGDLQPIGTLDTNNVPSTVEMEESLAGEGTPVPIAVATETPTPVATSTAEATATPSSTPSPTPTQTATRTPTATTTHTATPTTEPTPEEEGD
jgi:hypothetical protein